MKRNSYIFPILIALIINLFVTSCGSQNTTTASSGSAQSPTTSDLDQWLKNAELGPYAPSKQDWQAIETAAKKEGSLTVYSITANYDKIIKDFEKKYPGIKVENYNTTISTLLQRQREEQKAGIFKADVYEQLDSGELSNEFLTQKYIWNFVPDTTKFSEGSLVQPLLNFGFSGRWFIYNSELNDKCPITNVWELTEPQWKGKFIFPDPSVEAQVLSFFTNFTIRGDDMAKAYEEKYGKPPTLESDTPNAGYLWIKMIAMNEPVMGAVRGKISEAVGMKGMKSAPMGIDASTFYRMKTQQNLAFEPCLGLKPSLGIHNFGPSISISNRAPHPNAAKLFIQYALTPEGLAPMNEPGMYFIVEGVESTAGDISKETFTKETWSIDLNEIYKNSPAVRDFWNSVVVK